MPTYKLMFPAFFGLGKKNPLQNSTQSSECHIITVLKPSQISTSSNSSGRSRTSSLTKFIDMPMGGGGSSKMNKLSPSPFGRTPPAAPNTTPLGQSPAPPLPSGLTALAGWFRSRAGSVPSRPNLSSRRRHRTHSEGEKDSPDNQEATEAAQVRH